ELLSPLHDQPACMSFTSDAARPTPVTGVECTLDSGSRIPAPVRDLAYRVFLLQREPRRKRAEPAAGPSEGPAALRNWIVGRRVLCELERVPRDRTCGSIDEVAESRQPVLADKAVGIFGVPE